MTRESGAMFRTPRRAGMVRAAAVISALVTAAGLAGVSAAMANTGGHAKAAGKEAHRHVAPHSATQGKESADEGNGHNGHHGHQGLHRGDVRGHHAKRKGTPASDQATAPATNPAPAPASSSADDESDDQADDQADDQGNQADDQSDHADDQGDEGQGSQQGDDDSDEDGGNQGGDGD